MTPPHLEEPVSPAAQDRMRFEAIDPTVGANDTLMCAWKPESTNEGELTTALGSFGKSFDDAFEVHVTEAEDEMRLIVHCVSVDRPESAIDLLYTLFVGRSQRTCSRTHAHSWICTPGTITDTLKGTDFDTKLDVLLQGARCFRA